MGGPMNDLIERIEAAIAPDRELAPPLDVLSECVSVFHNPCGRRTIRKHCTCETCVAIEHSRETNNG